MKIYVASSWRNTIQPAVVALLQQQGHSVYDFRHPEPGNDGFGWSRIDPQWQMWLPEQYREALKHPIAQAGFKLDMDALRACDACVLVLPSGRSGSWEFGWACGNGKLGAVYMPLPCEPELMYADYPILTDQIELKAWAADPRAFPLTPALSPEYRGEGA